MLRMKFHLKRDAPPLGTAGDVYDVVGFNYESCQVSCVVGEDQLGPIVKKFGFEDGDIKTGTGVYDMNQTEIFEGDVIEYESPSNGETYSGQVHYHIGAFWVNDELLGFVQRPRIKMPDFEQYEENTDE